MSSQKPEPNRLKQGKAFHRTVQEEWRQEAEGKVEPEKTVKYASKGRGRVDIMVDAKERTKALVEIKHTDWDRMTEGAVRRNALRHIRQVWRYIDAQPNDADGVCPGVIYAKCPGSVARKQQIETLFIEAGIPVVWHDLL